jgi:hypothetical protein
VSPTRQNHSRILTISLRTVKVKQPDGTYGRLS